MAGEGKIVEFYSDRETFFYWNLDDYPVPVGTDLGSVCCNIFKALHLMGFEGRALINVDCKQLKYDDQELYKAGSVCYLPKWTHSYYDHSDAVPSLDMTSYMLIVLSKASPKPNIAVIAKKPNKELDRVLQCLKSRGHKVLLIEPPPDEECLFSVDYLLENARLLGEGKPIRKQELTHEDLWYSDSDSEDDGDDVSHLPNGKMLDFSEPIRHNKALSKTVIFWDAVDCPFPPSLSPDDIFEKIKSVLSEKRFNDNITIWAYVDAYKEGSPHKYRGDKSRIYFLPGGDKASRRIRMLNDMYLDARDDPMRYYDGNLILVSDQFSGDPYYTEMFENLANRKYFLVWLVPSEHSHISESPDEWPRSLLDRARFFDREINESSRRSPHKKPKLDAAQETPAQG